MTLSPAQLQQACDLINRFDEGDRTDAVAQKCKVGKLCPTTGRCIPKENKCAPTGGLKTLEESKQAEPKKGLTLVQKLALGYLGTAVGLKLAATAVVAHGLHQQSKGNKEYEEYLNKNPEQKATYEKAKAAAKATYGTQGESQVHETFKTNYQKQSGAPDPSKPKVKDWHKTLGVPKDATPEEIKKAYRKMAAKSHPDKGGKAGEFEKVNEAYEASKRKDSISQWQLIEAAYQSAQQQHSRIDSNFWKL